MLGEGSVSILLAYGWSGNFLELLVIVVYQSEGSGSTSPMGEITSCEVADNAPAVVEGPSTFAGALSANPQLAYGNFKKRDMVYEEMGAAPIYGHILFPSSASNKIFIV